MPTRRRLPNRRPHEVFEFELGVRYRAGVGYFENGGVAEIFLSANKFDSDLDVHARDSAIAASLALQYGASIEVIYKSMTKNANGAPSGPLGYILRELMRRNETGTNR